MNVDDYIGQFDGEVRERLLRLRKLVKTMTPDAEEKISYGMPAYKLHNKVLIYFMAHKEHIGVYPGRLESYDSLPELQKYASGKSTLKFPNHQPLPYDLIEKFINYRLSQITQ